MFGFETPKQRLAREQREAVERVQWECDRIMVNYLNYLIPNHPEWQDQIVYMYYTS